MATTTRTRAASRFDSLEQEVFLNLWRTYDRLRLMEDELFARFDLTPQQYNVLRLLRTQLPDSRPTLWLAERLVSRAPDITRMLDKLEQRRLIARHRPADNRRTVLIDITSAGTGLLDKIDEPLRACHERQLGHLPAAELKRLAKMLQAARAPHESADSSWI
ncbi:MAG: MarR family winged helix-turn-helix transcriptional regulator [Pirellulales bacterium]